MNDPPDWDGGLEEEYSLIMQQAGCDRETAVKALETHGNMAESIEWIIEQENKKHSMIMRATGCDRETAIKALVETHDDMAKSIMWIIETREDNNHGS